MVCGGTRFHVFAEGQDYELETCGNLWQFQACTACAHVQLDPRPRMADLAVIYPPHYYSYNIEKELSPIALRGKAILDGLKFKTILQHTARPPAAYVDIGCGNGRYLRLIENICGTPRANLFGLELDAPVVARLRSEGFQAFNSRVEDCAAIAPGSIELATMFHVIEHVADPGSVIGGIAEWLAPGGIIAIETPNLESWDAHLFKARFWGGYHIPRHWHLFRQETLRRILESQGLEVIDLRYQTGHSFWMYSVHHLLKYKYGMPRLARWFDPMKGLAFLMAFTAFDIARRFLGLPTSAMLMLARKPTRGSQ